GGGEVPEPPQAFCQRGVGSDRFDRPRARLTREEVLDPPPSDRSSVNDRDAGRGRRSTMGRQRHGAEEIIAKLREAEVELARGKTAGEVCRKLGVTEQTYYRWRREYGGLRLDQARRLKELERENARLKKLVADQALDVAILREAAKGNF